LESLKLTVISEDTDVDGRVVLKWILTKYGVRMWIGLIWVRIGTVVGSSEHGDESYRSVKGGGI
jgi:hypothetical protein